jgi:hypothetical protein
VNDRIKTSYHAMAASFTFPSKFSVHYSAHYITIFSSATDSINIAILSLANDSIITKSKQCIMHYACSIFQPQTVINNLSKATNVKELQRSNMETHAHEFNTKP